MREHRGTSSFVNEDSTDDLTHLTPEAVAARFWSIRDTATILGRIGRTGVWQLRKQGHLKTVRLGSRSLIDGRSLAAYMDQLRRQSEAA